MIRSLSIIFTLIAGLSSWFFFSNNHHKLKAAPTQIPDGFMLEAHYTQYDTQGQVHMVMYTQKMLHFAQDGTSYFVKPQVLAYSQQRTPWTIHAEEGTALHNSEQINLSKNVVIHQAGQPHHPETTITTATMTIFPHRGYAETNQPITIIRSDSHIDAIGMQANFKIGIFKLLSSVRGRLCAAPPNTSPNLL